MPKIKLSQLEMLVAAADAGSFCGAAIDLGCTQSRISHGIAELEQSVGAKLLDRSRSGCVLTHPGRQALGHARQMLRMADQLSTAVRNETHVRGHVQVACVRSPSTHLLPHVVEALANQFPEVHVEIHDGCNDYLEVAAMVEQGVAHIGITRAPISEQFMSRPFVHDDYVVVAPASAELKSPVCWEELSRLPFIQYEQPGAMWIIEQCRAAGFEQRQSRRMTNASSVLALVSRGLGYAVLPRLVALPDAPATKILSLPFVARRHLIVFAKTDVLRKPTVKTVMQFILDKRLIMKTDAWRSGAVGFDL